MARLFNGSSDVITGSSSSTGWVNQTSWSISVWFYVTSLPSSGNFMCLFGKRDLSHGAFVNTFIENVSGTVGFGAFNGLNFKAFGSISSNQWYNGVATGDGTSLICYLNGSLAGTDAKDYTSGFAGVSTESAPVCIGADFGGAGDTGQEFFAGRIADCAFWNSVKLTAAEAAALGAGVRPKRIRPQNLTVWYPLDGLQSPEPDLGGRAYNGTLTGTSLAAGPPMTMFTPRWPRNYDVAAVAPTTVFRKTASRIGTRVGTRQTWAA